MQQPLPEEGAGEEEEWAEEAGVASRDWNREGTGTAGDEEEEEGKLVIMRRNW